MKLNPDCIRAVLLWVEDLSDGIRTWMFHEIDGLHAAHPELNKFEDREIYYHVQQCMLTGYLYRCEMTGLGFSLFDLSPEGHEFLNNVRSETIWSKTKEQLEPVKTVSLAVIGQVASAVVKSALGLQ